MGKGDKKTPKGKRSAGSYGNARAQTNKKPAFKATTPKTAVVKKAATKAAPVKSAPAKKAPAKKAPAKKAPAA